MKLKLPAILASLAMSLALAQPLPQQVPQGKSAAEYFDLGKAYKGAGWTEQAREALQLSVKADPKGVGKQAQAYLDCYIPRFPVSQEAVQRNVEGYNQMVSNDLAGAEKTFLDCIRRYPRFEWPMGNLGMLYTQQGKTAQAEKVLRQALTLNPNYVNGWIHLAEACQKAGDKAGAQQAIGEALRLDPQNGGARALQRDLR